MEEIIPKTKKECFAQLNEILSEEDNRRLSRAKMWMNSILASTCGFETIGFILKASEVESQNREMPKMRRKDGENGDYIDGGLRKSM